MEGRQSYILLNDRIRANAIEAVRQAPEGYSVVISPKKRSAEQNAFLHSLLSDLSKAPVKWAGKKRSIDEWKVLVVSGHAVATSQPGEVIAGLESEFVAIRESTAKMSVGRAASLITYLLAFCDMNSVELKETEKCGFLAERTGQ